MVKRQIQNGNVYTEQCRFVNKTLYLAGDKIVTVEEYQSLDCPEEMVDAEGKYVIPGLTDIHFHGCMGYDCCDGTLESLRGIAEYEVKQGVTTITPATLTVAEETLMQVAKAAAEYSEESGSVLAGLYMEGPFINEEKKGAQNPLYIRKPDLELFYRLQEASGGRFRTIAMAPETEGAMEFIRALKGKVTISLAHMTADYETVCEALENGASQLTHLYNAMPAFVHRAPGPIGAAADHETCRAELICDGIHIHPAVVRNTFKMFGADRIIMISDSLRATGLSDGQYELGGQEITVKGKLATLKDGTIAGSNTSLMGCLKTAVKEMHIPLESAIKCAAVNPAKAIGIYGEYGSLEAGKYANVVILDQDLDVQQVYCLGRQVFE